MTKNMAGPKLLWPGILLFVVYLGVTVLLQILSGAYHAEFAGYPDESAHYVTSLMVRDFLASLHYTDPMGFAGETHGVRVMKTGEEIPHHQAGDIVGGFVRISRKFGMVGAAEDLEEDGYAQIDDKQ